MRKNIAASARRMMANGDARFEPEFNFGVVVELVGLGEELAVVLVPGDDRMVSRRNWCRTTEN